MAQFALCPPILLESIYTDFARFRNIGMEDGGDEIALGWRCREVGPEDKLHSKHTALVRCLRWIIRGHIKCKSSMSQSAFRVYITNGRGWGGVVPGPWRSARMSVTLASFTCRTISETGFFVYSLTSLIRRFSTYGEIFSFVCTSHPPTQTHKMPSVVAISSNSKSCNAAVK